MARSRRGSATVVGPRVSPGATCGCGRRDRSGHWVIFLRPRSPPEPACARPGYGPLLGNYAAAVNVPRGFLGLVVGLAMVAPALRAHGGQYRGPTPLVPPPGGPATGGPSGPAAAPPGPTTGGRASSSDSTSWQVWWEFNKDPFLHLRTAVHTGPASGSDEFFLGQRRAVVAHDALAPTARDRRDKIVPALARLLQQERNRDIVTACLVGLGKTGTDAPGIDLDQTFAAQLPRDDQEIRETAALAFGIAGRSSGMTTLRALLRDDADGRRLLGNKEVGDRTRAFAAYGLGLVAGASRDAAVKQEVHDLLAPLLRDKELHNRDLRVAIVQALGCLAPDPQRGADKRLLWQTLDELWGFYDLDLGKGDQLVQAHVPIAVARLLGRGAGDAHQRVKKRLLAELFPKEKRNNAIYQSAVLALGTLCLPAETNPDDAPFAAGLARCWREATDQQTRFFSLIALGRIGGAQNRARLIELYGPSSKAIEKPWAAMALGLIGHAAFEHGAVDDEVARLLLHDLATFDNPDAVAALAVAVGLTHTAEAPPTVIELLKKDEREEMVAGYLCISLALLDHQEAASLLSDLMERSIHRPFLLQQAAVALGCLGDKRATPLLQELLGKNESAAALAAIAGALAFIGDRRSIDPLIKLLQDEQLTKLARAFAAAALGGVGDRYELPWNVGLSVDNNYQAAVDTMTNGRNGVLDIL